MTYIPKATLSAVSRMWRLWRYKVRDSRLLEIAKTIARLWVERGSKAGVSRRRAPPQAIFRATRIRCISLFLLTSLCKAKSSLPSLATTVWLASRLFFVSCLAGVVAISVRIVRWLQSSPILFRAGLVTGLVTCSLVMGAIAPVGTNHLVPVATSPSEAATGDTDAGGVQATISPNMADNDIPSPPISAVPSVASPSELGTNNGRHLAVVGPAQIPADVRPKRGAVVAVLDTGIDETHEALSGLVVGDANFSESYDTKDRNGHGTYVAGIIAAKENHVGMVGVSPGCQLLNVKVADDQGRCEPSTLAEGIVWAADHGANVINISIELKESSPELEKAVNYAWEKGSLIIVAAGNNADESSVYPACYENCIAVSCLGGDDKLLPLSNCGAWVHVAAPGCNVYSCLPKNCYGYKSGTSCAAAYASGIAALLFATVDDANGDGRLNDDMKTLIESGYRQITVPAGLHSEEVAQ
jgi:subtilisin family serine protease